MGILKAPSTQTPKHPYFLQERKQSKFKKFLGKPLDTLEGISKEAREWVKEQGDKISIVGYAWSCVPTNDEEIKGPSSFDRVLTITYVEENGD